MKPFFLLIGLTLLLSSCSNNPEPIKEPDDKIAKSIKTELDFYSDIEKKGIEVRRTKQSDREAYSFVVKCYEEPMIFFREVYDEALNAQSKGYNRPDFGDIKKSYLNAMDDYQKRLDTLSRMKGDVEYTRVEIIKMNPDTLIHKIIYYDNNQKCLIARMYK